MPTAATSWGGGGFGIVEGGERRGRIVEGRVRRGGVEVRRGGVEVRRGGARGGWSNGGLIIWSNGGGWIRGWNE